MKSFRLPREITIALLTTVAMTTLAVTASSCATPAEAPVTPGKAPASTLETNLLSDGIRDELTGTSLETPENRERLRTMARELAALRQGRLASTLRRERLQSCQGDEPMDAYQAAYCRLTLKITGAARKQKKARNASSSKKAQILRNIVRAIHEGKTEGLTDATEAQLIDGLKKFRNSSQIRPLIENALQTKGCASTALLTGLGLKAEENFPNPDWKEMTQALYARAAECGMDSSSIKATYRLGLIQVWENKCEQAEKSFAPLTDLPDAVDFRSRVLYWRYFCAKQLGNEKLKDQLKATLLTDHPLSLHGLVTAGTGARALAETPPRIAFRSILKPSLTASVRFAEALQTEGAMETSVDALTPILDQMKGSEPEFQLYTGLLLTRAGDSLNKFKLLSSLFRDYPGLIARESLELLFPLERFEIIRTHEDHANPYLVISLIRQESAFNPRAKSRVGARGLMQLMPQTARRMERVSKNSLYDPKVNIRIGVRFFSRLNQRYGGEVEHALAAYNAGPEKVDVWKNRYPIENRLLFVDMIPFRETREYVASIARNYFFYKRLYAPDTAPTPPNPITAITGDAGHPEAPLPATKDRTPANEALSPFKLFDT